MVAALTIFGLQPAFAAPVTDYLRPVFLFSAGTLCYLYRDRIALRRSIGAGCCIVFIALFVLGHGNLAMTCVFPYILCCIIFSARQVPASLSRLGDYSYAMYLVAFPIQQMWVGWLPEAGIMSHTLLSSFSALLLSLPLYYLVEKPAGKRLAKVAKRTPDTYAQS